MMMLIADVDAVISHWSVLDQAWLGRHKRRFRVRTLYPMESVALDEQRREVPSRNANVLKIIKQVALGRLEMQAVKYRDKATIIDALDSDAACAAVFDLLSAEKTVDVREAEALAQARASRRLQ